MTEKEEKLLDFAKCVLENNPGCALTGSLSLAVRGICKRREAGDIDIVTDGKNVFVPNCRWKRICGSEKFANYAGVKYFDPVLHIHIDVMVSNEKQKVVNGVRVGEVAYLLMAKRNYAYNQEMEKHLLDLNYIFAKNPTLHLFFPKYWYLVMKDIARDIWSMRAYLMKKKEDELNDIDLFV